MRRILKIFVGLILLILCLSVLFAVGLHIFLKTDRGERFFLDTLNSFIPGRIESRDAEISLLGQSAALSEGVLFDPDNRAVIRVDSLRVRISYLALLKNRLVFSSISAIKPEIMLSLSKDNELNIVQAVVEEEEPSEETVDGLEVIIESFHAEDGFIEYTDMSSNFNARLQKVNLEGSMDFSKLLGKMSASIGVVWINPDDSPISLSQARIYTSLENDRLSPLFLEISRGRYEFNLKGSVRDVFTKPFFDLTLDSRGPISDLAAVFDSEESFDGTATSRIQVRGALDNPDCSGDILYSGGQITGLRVGKSNVSFRLKDRVLALNEAASDIAGGKANARGTIDLRNAFPQGFIESSPDYRQVSYALALAASGIDFREILPGQKTYPDSVSGKVDLSGKGIRIPDISGRASYVLHVRGAFPDVPVAMHEMDIKGEADLDYPSLRVSTESTTGTGISAALRGLVNLASQTVQADMSLDVQSVESALPGIRDRVSGSLAANSSISGPIERPKIDASLNGRNLRWQDYIIGDVKMDAGLDETGTLHIARLTVNNGEPVLSARGSIKVFGKAFSLDPIMPVSLEANLQSSNLRGLIAQEGVKGSIEGNLNIEGNLFDPSGSVQFTGNNIAVDGVSLGNIQLRGGISDGIFKVGQLSLTNKGSSVSASGQVHILDTKRRRLVSDPEIALSLAGNDVRLEDFTPEAKGLVSVRAQVDGSIKDPKGWARANGIGLEVAGQMIAEARISSVMADRKVAIENADIFVRPGQRISGKGWISLEKRNDYSVEISTPGIALDSFPFLRAYQVTNGRLVFDISGRGSLEDPQLKGSVKIMDVAVRNQKLEDISIGLEMDGWNMNLSGEDSFSFSGVYNVKSGDLAVEALFENTELSPYFMIAGRPDLHGSMNASAEIKGNTNNIRNIDLSLFVSGIDIYYRQNSLISAHDLTVRYRNRRLEVPRSRIYLMDKGSMTVQATTDLKGWLDLQAQGTVPLEIAGAFDPELAELGGTVRFGVAARGPITNPAVNGDIFLDGIQYVIPFNDQNIHSTNGHIRLNNKQVTIDNLTGRMDTGNFAIGGTIGLKGFSPVGINLNVRARSLPVVVPDTMNLLLEANLELTGTPDDTLLSGNTIILDGLYYRDVQLDLIAEVGERLTGARPRVEAPREPIDLPFLRNMALDVSVSRKGPVIIENNLADATISPDLQIIGTLNDPVITGRISVTSGTVTYQQRTFDITKGVVDFSNPYRTEPVVDISAEGTIREWTIFLAVSGPLDNLNIQLTSNPPAEDAVILSLLATGRTPEELVGRPGAATSSPSNLLAEVLASTYGEQVRRTTGLDILELETEAPATVGQAEAIRFTVGEELTRRLTIKYSIETSENELTRTTIAEYKFLENLLINGFQDSKGVFGADLQFRLEFR